MVSSVGGGEERGLRAGQQDRPREPGHPAGEAAGQDLGEAQGQVPGAKGGLGDRPRQARDSAHHRARLSYLHSRKIVHRDVKTENMLLDTQRNLKTADFGVARVEAQNPKDMTGATGTLGYMASEVLEGKPYNRKCDVYSFGICLWEIYCCDMPYPDLSFADVSSAVVHQNLRSDIPRRCPSAMANIMRKCSDANPDKRPDMDEVVRLLEALDASKGGGMIPEGQAGGCLCFFRARGP